MEQTVTKVLFSFGHYRTILHTSSPGEEDAEDLDGSRTFGGMAIWLESNKRIFQNA